MAEASVDEDAKFWEDMFDPENGIGRREGKSITCHGCPACQGKEAGRHLYQQADNAPG